MGGRLDCNSMKQSTIDQPVMASENVIVIDKPSLAGKVVCQTLPGRLSMMIHARSSVQVTEERERDLYGNPNYISPS